MTSKGTTITIKNDLTPEQMRELVRLQAKRKPTDKDRETAARIINEIGVKVNGVPIRDHMTGPGGAADNLDLLAGLNIRPAATAGAASAAMGVGPVAVVAAVVVVTGIPGDTPVPKPTPTPTPKPTPKPKPKPKSTPRPKK